MKKTLLVLLLCGYFVGCGSSNNSSSSSSLSGNWQFTFTSTPFERTITGAASLTQSGNTVSGTVNFTGDPCATSAALSGSASGTAVTFSVVEGTQTVGVTGTANSTDASMSGTYSSSAGGCLDGDYGSWAASKS